MPWPDGPSRYSLRACCGSYRGDLRAIELGQYLIARSVGDELALVENHDPADQAQERGAVGYDEEGSALQFRAEPVEKPAFRLIIHGAGRFVEYQHRWTSGQGTGDGDRLALTPGQAFPPVQLGSGSFREGGRQYV